ncbi:crotonase/enoyl-CoA hydratase family protein [Nocardioides houyundeii]|uniref:crotonase/enoyl-CoA hydratase family protein n=2 Tax=Nocardioides houyundeii TaxID=2045452 RepID=UPI000DF2B6FB|nr:crotonase/enoyl-CoA hydratase family protein [Nocardioides houyundeii]
MSEVLTVEREDHVETWTLNMPEKRNPISGADVVEAFVANTGRVELDLDVRCVILTGSGSAFSAGGDVQAMADGEGMFGGSPFEQRNGYRQGIQRIPLAMQACEVPMIAAVNGAAVGAGCDLALMCDLRIASEKAFFAESFAQLGLIPGDGGAWLLSRAIGPARAAEMALTGDRVDAATALEWGLVSRVTAPEDLMDEARSLAARVAKNPAHALRMAKKLLRESQQRDLAGVLELSAAYQALAHHTDEHRAAVDAFVNRRR